MPMTGDDVQDLIAANGGSGAFEENTNTAVERWSFPRFAGATDEADYYLSRAGIGAHDSDVETLVAWLEAPRNRVGGVLVLGEPGGGKTACIEAAVTHLRAGEDEYETEDGTPDLLTVLCTPDHTKDSLFLRFVGEDHGTTLPNGKRSPYTLGPVPTACKYGKKLYCDEAMMLVDGVKPILYSLADGRRFLPEGNVDGSALEIHPDFRLILSSNPLVRGASLPEPLASRFASTTLHIETSADLLIDLGVDETVVAAWEALKAGNHWAPQIRELRMADYWLSQGAVDQAASAFLPEHCPESQRKEVKNIVLGMLGGDLSDTGRLVVA